MIPRLVFQFFSTVFFIVKNHYVCKYQVRFILFFWILSFSKLMHNRPRTINVQFCAVLRCNHVLSWHIQSNLVKQIQVEQTIYYALIGSTCIWDAETHNLRFVVKLFDMMVWVISQFWCPAINADNFIGPYYKPQRNVQWCVQRSVPNSDILAAFEPLVEHHLYMSLCIHRH